MEYIIANSILILIALIGSFIIGKCNEGILMGINEFFISIYLLVIGVVAIVVNLILVIISVVT